MAEPLFFDCLTDLQIWSLFNTGVLHESGVPIAVYERLKRIAPEHRCYLFTWPAGLELPVLHELVPALEASPGFGAGRGPETTTAEGVCAAVQVWAARTQPRRTRTGERIYLVCTSPEPSLRPGPKLEVPARDLSAMSMPELEAYLDDVLRVDEASRSP
jgi:hypothetical protein